MKIDENQSLTYQIKFPLSGYVDVYRDIYKIHLLQIVKSPKTIDGIYSVTLPVTITVTLHTVTQIQSHAHLHMYSLFQQFVFVTLKYNWWGSYTVQFQEICCSADVASIVCYVELFIVEIYIIRIHKIRLCVCGLSASVFRSIKWRHMLWMVMGHGSTYCGSCMTHVTHPKSWPIWPTDPWPIDPLPALNPCLMHVLSTSMYNTLW